MRTNKNFCFVQARFKNFTPDKLEKLLPVDQFPVKKFNINKFGWPKSDITILDEISKSQQLDLSFYNAFASRLNVIRAERGVSINFDDSTGMLSEESENQIAALIKEFHPAWIQTVSEERDFAAWYSQNYDKLPESTSTEDSVDDEDSNSD